MHKYQSQVVKAGTVSFPDYKGERIYMEPFYQDQGLPAHLKRWQSTVDQMLVGVKTDQPIYLMIDQAFVQAGKAHRRPGVHVDGYWVPMMASHGGNGGGGHSSNSGGGHGSKGGHGSSSGSHGATAPSTGGHGSSKGTHASSIVKASGSHGGHSFQQMAGKHAGHKAMANGQGSWENSTFDFPEAIILASNVAAARAYAGEYQGPIKDMGDCAHLTLDGLEQINMEANHVYLGNVTFLHESLPVEQDCYRTLVRLNVPGFAF